MRFLGSKFTQNALAAGAPHRTPLGELKRSSTPPSRFKGAASRQGTGERGGGGGGEGKGNSGIGKGKREGREGKGREEGREGKGKEEGKGWEGEFASLVLGDRRP